MNFLAHIFLSDNDDHIAIGNFIGDFIKGKEYLTYPEKIQLGILLHRYIDAFTDSHEIVMQGKIRLRETFGHYAPVIMDMYYDHLLAKNWENFSSIDLKTYTANFYQVIGENSHYIPKRAAHMLTYMIPQNWLLNYQHLEGLQRALAGMSRRTKFDSKMELATQHLAGHYQHYEEEFMAFFPIIQEKTRQFIHENLNQ